MKGSCPFLVRVNLFVLLILALTGGTGFGRNPDPSPGAVEMRQEFISRCPRPTWWGRVSIDALKINTYDYLLKYWQNSRRSESEFFKAAYQAIVDFPLDPDIVVHHVHHALDLLLKPKRLLATLRF